MERNNNDNQFNILAKYYDVLNYNADYKKVAGYIEDVFEIYQKKPNLILDLACGTGDLTIELDKRKYDMTGLDISVEMLSAAMSKAVSKNQNTILWINQDMRSFELYGTVDAVICCFDSLNYILEEENIEKCFKSVYNYLNPGGLFVFDVNSKYKFEHTYADNDIILENGGVFCSWRNSCKKYKYNNKNKEEIACDFYLTLFVMDGETEEIYKRYDETLKQKYYDAAYLEDILAKIKFENINIYYDFSADKNNKDKVEEKEKDIKKKGQKKERICFAALKK